MGHFPVKNRAHLGGNLLTNPLNLTLCVLAIASIVNNLW